MRRRKLQPANELCLEGSSLSDVKRFMEFITPGPDGCWLWTGSKDSNHYGRFKIGGQVIGAHRVSYALFKGLVPHRRHVHHHCAHHNCVNPEHMSTKTWKENSSDGGKRSHPKLF